MKTVAVTIFAFCILALSSASRKSKHCYSNADCKAGQCCSTNDKSEKHRYCVNSNSPLYISCPELPTPRCKTSADCAEGECCVIAEGYSGGRSKRDSKQKTGTCQKLGALGDSCLISVTSISNLNPACPCGPNLACVAYDGSPYNTGNCTEITVYPV